MGRTYRGAMAASVPIRHVTVALDCPDHVALAGFYAALTGREVDHADEDWAQLTSDGSVALAFQHVEDYRRPQWPGQDVPQQVHLDLAVDDLDRGEEFVLGLGATKPEPNSEHPDGFRVFLDPAGHPFCLVQHH